MTKDNLSDYLHRVFDLEISVFQQKRIISQLIYARDNVRVGQFKPIEKIDTRSYYFQDDDFVIGICLWIHILWFLAVTVCVPLCNGTFINNIYDTIAATGLKWYFSYAITAILLPVSVDIVIALIVYISHSLKYKEYVYKMERKNDVAKKHNLKIAEWRESEKNKIICKIHEIEKYFKDTKNVLEELYDKNVIYGKYCNMVAIGTFCEYFDSGRCTTLEGHEGAYNIYENEIRQNIIISKLDDIISRLDSIEQNQYLLYQSIQESNQTIKNIGKELLSKVEHIEDSEQLHLYYSKITARNTEFLKWEKILSNAIS